MLKKCTETKIKIYGGMQFWSNLQPHKLRKRWGLARLGEEQQGLQIKALASDSSRMHQKLEKLTSRALKAIFRIHSSPFGTKSIFWYSF